MTLFLTNTAIKYHNIKIKCSMIRILIQSIKIINNNHKMFKNKAIAEIDLALHFV